MKGLKYKHLNKEWYCQGAESIPYLCNVPYFSTFLIFGPKESVVYFKGVDNYGYFGKKRERQLAESALRKQGKDKRYIDKIIQKWRKIVKKQNKLYNLISRINLTKLSDKELIVLNKKINDFNLEFWKTAIFIEPFDSFG